MIRYLALLLFLLPAAALAEETRPAPPVTETVQLTSMVAMLAQQLAQAQVKISQLQAELDGLKAASK